jgi:2,4-dienoyl-CoA reductase-like NADH-dependent reductase (Old Yellow Enzyme family)/thioredoxin reductase
MTHISLQQTYRSGKMNPYPNLFSPIQINGMILRNRIIATPCGAIQREKACGGAAMLISGSGMVDDPRAKFGPIPYMFSKYERQKTRSILDTAHQGGSRVSLEIMHSGRYARVDPGDFVWGPCSGITKEGTPIKALDEKEMERICNAFADAALTAKIFGFDMVMLHFAHGWLPAEFLSPAWNHRTDEYGGSFENRARFPKRIIETVRKTVGKDFPIDMRISAYEWIPESIEFKDVVHFVQEVEPFIDMVNVSAGLDIEHEANVHMATSFFEPHMVNVEWAAEIKKNVHIPVSVVGAIMTPEEAEEIIASGKADMVSLGRILVADPQWGRKALENRAADIVPCIRCNYCYHISTNRMNVGCTVNPRYGREEIIPFKLERAEKVKKVVVIGGGPGGMKAALTAAERGHQVILLERSERLGGQINCSDYDDYKQDLKRYRDYLLTQVKKSTVEVRLNTEATPEMVRKLEPDALIIAVGADVVTPAIPGVEHAKQAVEAYPHLNEMRGKIVVIGGGTIGSEIGLELAERGNTVHIVEITDTLNAQGNMLYRIAIRQHMEKCKTLHTMTETKCKEIKADGVVVEKDGEERFLEADHILLATGLRSRRDVAHSFYGITQDTFIVGDCNRVGNIKDANELATLIAMNL